MNLRAMLLLIASPLLFAQHEDRVQDLNRVAQVATAMVDGDVCRRIQTPRSLQFLSKTDPRDPWLASDNFDVDDAAFIQTKKTLIRLARLCSDACDANLWMPVKSNPPRIQILIRNVYEMSGFWKWGELHQDMPAEMKRVLDTGERVTVGRSSGMISVLTPVYDSLGDIVALVEVVSQARRDLRENVK
jgi:hypothetical protein